jgi:hypothetical protein
MATAQSDISDLIPGFPVREEVCRVAQHQETQFYGTSNWSAT